MDQTTSSRQEEERDLRSAVQYAVAQICENQKDGTATMSPSTLAALSELTFCCATCSLSNDLVWFARHANRRTVTVDDVKLVARKNPNHLLEQLESFAEQRKLQKGLHTMEAVRKERAQSPKKQQKSASRKSLSITKRAQQKSAAIQEDERQKQTRQRLLAEIDRDDSTQDSFQENQDLDMESTDSDGERAL